MVSIPQAEKTPNNVAQTATQENALPHGGTVVLGVFGSASAPEALVRTSGGQIRRIKTGSRLAASQVVAIDERGLVLQRGSRTQRLEIPGG